MSTHTHCAAGDATILTHSLGGGRPGGRGGGMASRRQRQLCVWPGGAQRENFRLNAMPSSLTSVRLFSILTNISKVHRADPSFNQERERTQRTAAGGTAAGWRWWWVHLVALEHVFLLQSRVFLCGARCAAVLGGGARKRRRGWTIYTHSDHQELEWWSVCVCVCVHDGGAYRDTCRRRHCATRRRGA
jgi:hypothetical protein